ncbi:MAG: hypothetical protein ACLQU5_09670 [Isosphaeraceae bacterium]
MKRSPQVRVTLSDDLLNHLRKTAREQHVPLRWLVAGLVCDTLEARAEHHKLCRPRFSSDASLIRVHPQRISVILKIV